MDDSAKVKILIVYERSGMGHEIMANILAEQILQDDKTEIFKYTITELLKDPLSEFLTKTWVSAWNFFLRHNLIKLADGLINYLMRLILLPIGEVSSVAAMHQALDQISPDILICTADTAGKCLGTWAKEKQVPFFLVITDLSIFIDLVSPDAIHICYFPETVKAIQSFNFQFTYWSEELTRFSKLSQQIKFISKYLYDFVICYPKNRIYRNINQDYLTQNQAVCHAIGPLREAKHFTIRNKQIIRKSLKLPPKNSCILIISGSFGGNFCTKYLRCLENFTLNNLVIIVACGRDEKLLLKIKKIAQQKQNYQIFPLEFVDNLHEWMSAVDVILARPSAGVLLESLLAHTPLLLPRQAAANDRGAINFVEKYQLGECFKNQRDLQLKLKLLLENNELYQQRIKELLKDYPSTFAEQSDKLRAIFLQCILHKEKRK
jgi:UDP-N-acetylglucosamine:LPS N-acetylglucosamine transferase